MDQELPTAASLVGTFGNIPADGKEGNYWQVSIVVDEETQAEGFELKHKSCMVVPAGKPLAGSFVDETNVFKGSIEIEAAPQGEPAAASNEGKEAGQGEEGGEGKGEEASSAPQVSREDITAAFEEKDPEGAGLSSEQAAELLTEAGVAEDKITSLGLATEGITLSALDAALVSAGLMGPPPPPPAVVLTLTAATKVMTNAEDGAFADSDQPHSRYSWKFLLPSDRQSLVLQTSNYPISMTSESWAKGDQIEMKWIENFTLSRQ